MKLSEIEASLIGNWAGTNILYASWLPDPERPSHSSLSVAPAAKGNFLTFTYTWIFEEALQEGLLIVGNNNEQEVATAAWVDSWHMSNKIMLCTGSVDQQGVITVQGSYEAPPGPDWGWRITITPVSGAELRLVMHNLSPEGKDELAVQANYTRA
ncbi:MAG: DUF1579 family protein [Anaerolineales bacterium]